MTCESLQPIGLLPMELPSTPFAAVFPVRTLARPESAPASQASEAAYGRNIGALLASFDPSSCSLRTSQPSLGADSIECSVTLPRSGMMRSGIVSAVTPWVQASIGSASGFWHTPTTRDYKGQSGAGNRKRRGRGGRLHIANLCDQLWDTGRLDLVRSATFREWLMGLPIGHTDLGHLATP